MFTDTTETYGTRILRFRTYKNGEVFAFITSPIIPRKVVGEHRPDGHVWAAHASLNDSVEFPGMDVESWKAMIRLVHLYV